MAQTEISLSGFHGNTETAVDYSYVRSYLTSPARNHVVFSRQQLPSVSYYDAGKVVAKAILDGGFKPSTIESLFPAIPSDEFGAYVAIKNIGILFESQLKLDVRHILDSLSQNNALYICDTGSIEGETFLFFSSDSGVKVNLSGISFITI